MVNLSIYRGARAGAFDEHDLDLIRFLKPHIEKAYRLHSELIAARNRACGLQSALDSLLMGVILLGAKGQIITMNRAAEHLLATRDGLHAIRRKLSAERSDETSRLSALVADTTATSSGSDLRSGGALALSRRNGSSLQLLVSPIGRFDLDENNPVRAIVFVSDPSLKRRPAHEMLFVMFRLTPAESRIAMLLADGRVPRAIAEMIGISRNTLKSQLHKHFPKN